MKKTLSSFAPFLYLQQRRKQRSPKMNFFFLSAGKFLISQEILPTITVEPSVDTRNVDPKRMAVKSPYKPMNETEFLSKSENEIRREFRKLPDPPAKDPFAAKLVHWQSKTLFAVRPRSFLFQRRRQCRTMPIQRRYSGWTDKSQTSTW